MKLIQSFARPGGNITGVTQLNIELAPKRLEVFYELVSGLKRVLFLYDAHHANAMAWVHAYRDAARRLGVVLVEHAIRTIDEARAALMQVPQDEVDGILQPPSLSLNLPGLVLEFSAQHGIPTMFNASFWAESGALASYGPDFHETGRQAARLVDKILKGANPAEIPTEVNSKIEFAINLKTAKTLGLTIAPEVLYQANRLIR
jgi:putative ABC transport system substrate-binding protein